MILPPSRAGKSRAEGRARSNVYCRLWVGFSMGRPCWAEDFLGRLIFVRVPPSDTRAVAPEPSVLRNAAPAMAAHQPVAQSMSLEHLSRYFHLPINDVAKELGVCATVLKKICRRNGIPRWPHRKVSRSAVASFLS